MKPKTNKWLGRWYVIVTILIILVAVIVRIQGNDLPKESAIPTPVMPSPNARDTFNAAEALKVNGDMVDETTRKPLTDTPPQGEDVSNTQSPWHVFSWSEKEKLVAENQPAVSKLREGLTQQYVNPPLRSFAVVMPYLGKDRAMARLLSLRAQVEAHDGNWQGAARSCIDAIQLGSQVPHGSNLIGMLVGCASESIGRRRMKDEGIIDHLSASDAKADAKRMAQIDANEVPYSDTLQEEKWDTQAGLIQIFNKPNWRGGFFQSMGGAMSSPSPTESIDNLRQMFLLATVSPKRSYQQYSGYMDQVIADAKQPWPIQRSTPEPAIPSDPICQVILPVFTQANFKCYVNRTLSRMLETQVALRAYYLDHHAYPASLAQLTPVYLPSVPLDPFSNNLPFVYRLDGSSYTLYSVGQDGIDNGGKPIDNSAFIKSPATRWAGAVTPQITYDPTRDATATGDIVAGVNE